MAEKVYKAFEMCRVREWDLSYQSKRRIQDLVPKESEPQVDGAEENQIGEEDDGELGDRDTRKNGTFEPVAKPWPNKCVSSYGLV